MERWIHPAKFLHRMKENRIAFHTLVCYDVKYNSVLRCGTKGV